MNNTAANSAASIYGRRKTTSDLEDQKFASELNQYQQRKGDNVAIQKAQMDQQIKQHRELRLPQERLQQTRNQREEALQGNRFGSFAQPAARQAPPAAPAAAAATQGRPTQQQLIAAQQKQRALAAQQRNNQENRFELFYSKSSRGSLQNAEVIMQGLSNYFTDGFIRQHVLAINFDDNSNIGPVHEAILNNERYLAIIQMDCILFDKFERYIILPEHNILRILKNHCQSFAPKQTTPPNERQWQMDRARQQAMYEQQQAEAEAQAARDAQHNARLPFAGANRNTQEAMNRQRPVVDTEEAAAAMPPRGMAGFSAMAKQVGADLNSPSSDVKLHHVVPHASNSLMTAETLEEVEALPATNMSLIYGKNKGCTLGYGNDLQRIEQDFVAAHNASNPTNREITSQSMMKPPKKRANETQMLNTQRMAPRAPAPPAGPNLQHLQGLERSPMEELGGRSVKGGEQQAPQKKFQPFQVTKPKKARATASE